jgi:5-methylcytosine-specific restriction endonuclease McrA
MTRIWRLPEDRKPLTRKQYAELFMKQDGKCPNCGQRLEIKGGQEVDIIKGEPARDEHLTPLWAGGSNDIETNRELWCLPCTKPKTASEATQRAESNRTRDKHIGAMENKRGKMPFGRKDRVAAMEFEHGAWM